MDERVVNPQYERNVRRVAGKVQELSVPAINRYLRMRLAEVSSVTASWERDILCGVWRWAYDRDLVEAMPRGIVKVKAVKPPVRAWTLEQCCTAVKASFQHDHTRLRTGVNLGKFLRCWLLLGYESGARKSDLWKMRDTDFQDDTLYWSQNKTGEPVPKVLSPACMRAVSDMLADSPDGTVLGWALHKQAAGRRMKEFLKGLKYRGSSKWLRRSSCTHIEMEHPGKGRLHLGHKTVGMAERHYIDWTQVRRDVPQAPNLLE